MTIESARFTLVLAALLSAGCSFDSSRLDRWNVDGTTIDGDVVDDVVPIDASDLLDTTDVADDLDAADLDAADLDASEDLDIDLEADVPSDIVTDLIEDLADQDLADIPDLADVPDTVDLDDLGDLDIADDDMPPIECLTGADCVTLYGAPPCGTWECNLELCEFVCPGCTDADHDGYGTGDPGACAGPDCDDADDTVFDSANRACYTGAEGTLDVGVCHAGQQSCTAGLWSECLDEVTPTEETCNNLDDDCDNGTDDGLGTFTCGQGACESTAAVCVAGEIGVCVPGDPLSSSDATCDGVDDDCDGAIDENCPTCVTVSPSGEDEKALEDNNATPFATIQAAIDWADADLTRPQRVCVAGGPTCSDPHTYNEDVTMADGISVQGGFETTGWTHCSGFSTTIVSSRDVGLLFSATVQTTTELSFFRIFRATDDLAAAITVNGATNVRISNIYTGNEVRSERSYGVNAINGAEVTVSSSSLLAGIGSEHSAGVRAFESTVSVIGNCEVLDEWGHCQQSCGNLWKPGIRGRRDGADESLTFGVWLEDAPGSQIIGNALCSVQAQQGAAIRIEGDATDVVVEGNIVEGDGASDVSMGIWLDGCDGAAPWIVSNTSIFAEATTQSTSALAIRSSGDCAPIIRDNDEITAAGDGNLVGVYCGLDQLGVASLCEIDDNDLILASAEGGASSAVGVYCIDGGCERVTGNIIEGGSAELSVGLFLEYTDTTVAANDITGGCGDLAFGISAVSSGGRIENNFIRGGTCFPAETGSGQVYVGLGIETEADGRELDVHSNTIAAVGGPNPCISAGVGLDVGDTPSTEPEGSFRNNAMTAGQCDVNGVFAEYAQAADPAIFENNNLDPKDSPFALYLNEGILPINDIATVNGFADIQAAGNISVDALYDSYPADLHLTAGSLCIDAGSTNGAPSSDVDGEPRDDGAPDIGADEI